MARNIHYDIRTDSKTLGADVYFISGFAVVIGLTAYDFT